MSDDYVSCLLDGLVATFVAANVLPILSVATWSALIVVELRFLVEALS